MFKCHVNGLFHAIFIDYIPFSRLIEFLSFVRRFLFSSLVSYASNSRAHNDYRLLEITAICMCVCVCAIALSISRSRVVLGYFDRKNPISIAGPEA